MKKLFALLILLPAIALAIDWPGANQTVTTGSDGILVSPTNFITANALATTSGSTAFAAQSETSATAYQEATSGGILAYWNGSQIQDVSGDSIVNNAVYDDLGDYLQNLFNGGGGNVASAGYAVLSGTADYAAYALTSGSAVLSGTAEYAATSGSATISGSATQAGSLTPTDLPTAPTSPGAPGQITTDGTYLYFTTGANAWLRTTGTIW